MAAAAAADSECDLGDPFDVCVRCTVVMVCCSALVAKKCLEGHDRRWDDFLLDGSKQLIGVGWAHLLAWLVFGGYGGSCDDRWLRTVLTATLGVAVEFVLLNIVASSLEGAVGDTGDFTTGEYRDASGTFVMDKYVKQLAVWLGCVLGAQGSIAWLLWQFGALLQAIAGVLLAVVSWSAGLELAVVGVLSPCCCSALQVWLTDDFLRVGGLPISEVVSALAARVWPAAEQLPSWVMRRDWTRPLLHGRAADEEALPLGKAGTGHAEAPRGAAGGPPPPPATTVQQLALEEGGQHWEGPATSSPTASRSPGRGGRRTSFNLSEPEKPKALHPELQEALAGMEYQVARALGSAPSAIAEAVVVSSAGELHKPHFDALAFGTPTGMETETDVPESEDSSMRGRDTHPDLRGFRAEPPRGGARASCGRAGPSSRMSPGGPWPGGASFPAEQHSPMGGGARERSDAANVFGATRSGSARDVGRRLRSAEGAPVGRPPEGPHAVPNMRPSERSHASPFARPSDRQHAAPFGRPPERPERSHAPPMARPSDRSHAAQMSPMGGFAGSGGRAQEAAAVVPLDRSIAAMDEKIAALEAKIRGGPPPPERRGEASPRSGPSDGVIEQFLGKGGKSVGRSLF